MSSEEKITLRLDIAKIAAVVVAAYYLGNKVEANKATSDKKRVFHTKKWPRASNLSEVFIHGQRNPVNTYYVMEKDAKRPPKKD